MGASATEALSPLHTSVDAPYTEYATGALTSTPPSNEETAPSSYISLMQANDCGTALPPKPPRIFALLVGIDKYRNTDIPVLSGCINDCKNFAAFLLENLGVPEGNIRSLHNGAATRDAILGAIDSHLLKNERIVKGDVILVFFAGHGSRIPAPEGWAPQGSKVEAIRPHDEGVQEDGTPIYGIPDRTIAVLMAQLSRRKGDNIVTIFDCCYSGGLSRGPVVRSSRAIGELALLPADLDQDIGDRDPDALHAILSSSFLNSNSEVTSHVMLAACHETESALETMRDGVNYGLFTYTLLEALRGHVIGAITYEQLIRGLPDLRLQSPQCVGFHKHRALFEATEGGSISDGPASPSRARVWPAPASKRASARPHRTLAPSPSHLLPSFTSPPLLAPLTMTPSSLPPSLDTLLCVFSL